ncbi:MAG: transposase [Actinomycetota bacterium]|nr:transposase [Actinomycetota bacterium]
MSTPTLRTPATTRTRSGAVPADRTEPSPPTGRRRTPAQIVVLLQHADELLTRGYAVAAVIDAIGVSEATFHRWRAHYGGIKAQDAQRLRELEKENRDLISLVANQSLDILMLRQAMTVDVLGPRLRAGIVRALRAKFGVSERRACEVIGQPRSSQRRMVPSDCAEEDPDDSVAGEPQPGDPDVEPTHTELDYAELDYAELDYAELVATYPDAAEQSLTPTTLWRPR